MPETRHPASVPPAAGSASSSVTSRNVVSAPARVIQVERVKVSDEHRSSVASAIRTGRKSSETNTK